jgi:hypothetical protein
MTGKAAILMAIIISAAILGAALFGGRYVPVGAPDNIYVVDRLYGEVVLICSRLRCWQPAKGEPQR